MNKTLGIILRGVLLIGMLGIIAYTAMCVYGNFINPSGKFNESPDIPDSQEAAYSLVVKNTSTLILTNKFEQFGEDIGNRTFVLSGYWELVGNEFKYRNRSITLSENIFGEIMVKRR